tara:strand:+ start:741 stop:1541 length:801 start_codon:yes stop_codon:yes gene_type:complete
MSFNKLNILNKLLNFLGVKSYRQIDNQKINDIISLLKPYDVEIPLIRVGEDTDGGYLLPDILKDIDYCFSPGVGNSSSFEKNLESYGIKSFLADKNVDGPAEKLTNFSFDKKNIHSFNQDHNININDWLLSKVSLSELNKSILQIDTDGFEYEILIALNEKILSEIKILIIEFHGLEFAGNEYFNFILKSVLSKINLFHSPIHIHPNNCCGIHNINKFKIPSVLEVTLLNKKLINQKKPIKFLPNALDRKNVKSKKEIFLENYWYN